MKIISWNVNGIKSLIKNGYFDELISKEDPDIFCLQEVKSNSIPDVEGYHKYLFASGTGYAGVAVYTKIEPIDVMNGYHSSWDKEGRLQRIEFENFRLFNYYAPSGACNDLEHKFKYYEKVTQVMKKSQKPVILCGDLNRMATEIDAKNPDNLKNKSGFLPEERAWFNDILKDYIDAFRLFHDEEEKYSWWAYGYNCYENNVGIRLDYFLVDKKLKDTLNDSYILRNQRGSDHAPIVLELNSCPACGIPNFKNNPYCYSCGTKLIEDEDNDEILKVKKEIPKDKIILLDLNYTLVANSKESFGPYPDRIYRQIYEEDLIELIKDNYVILITARPYKFSYPTLRHLKETTGFEVDEHFWNFGLQPPQLKKYWMEKEVLPKHGDNPSKYLAIESNPKTRAMYKKLGIEAAPKTDFI